MLEQITRKIETFFNIGSRYYIRVGKQGKVFFYELLRKELFRVHFVKFPEGKLINLEEHPEARLMEISREDFEEARSLKWDVGVAHVAKYLKRGN